MKFLCPQCKAKYRIADEKLAQRASSKMKCRKCGFVIDVHSAAVPESIRLPGDHEHDDEGDEEPAPARPAPGAGTPPPRRTAAQAPAKRVAPPAKRPGGASPPRRTGAVAVAEAVAEPTSEPEDEPIRPAPIAAPPRNEFEEDAPTRIHDGTALTAAFSFAAGGGQRESVAPQSVPDEWYIGIDGAPVGPLTMVQLREKAASGKATLDSLVWKDGFEEWKPVRDFPEIASLIGDVKPQVVEPRALAAPVAPAPSKPENILVSESPGDVLEQLGVRQRRHGPHPAAWAAVIVALAFGVTIGIVLFSKTEKQEIVKYIEVPASAKADTLVDPGTPAQVIEDTTVSSGTGPKRPAGGGPKVDTPPPAPSAKGLSGLSGLTGLNGLGPTANGPDVASGTAPGGQLDGASIQRVVANFSPSVRRGCWQPALEGRGPDAPSSARVGLTITVSASGNVDNVTTTGDPKGYPNLSHCIESKVRGWKFPRSSGTTTVQVPFVFAAQ